MLNLVEIEPGYRVDGIGLVEIGPGYGVNGFGAHDVQLVGAGFGAYDNVQLVGAFGALADKGLWSRNMLIATGAGLLATAATAFLLGKSFAYGR